MLLDWLYVCGLARMWPVLVAVRAIPAHDPDTGNDVAVAHIHHLSRFVFYTITMCFP
jgi:hypothetical protein